MNGIKRVNDPVYDNIWPQPMECISCLGCPRRTQANGGDMKIPSCSVESSGMAATGVEGPALRKATQCAIC